MNIQVIYTFSGRVDISAHVTFTKDEITWYTEIDNVRRHADSVHEALVDSKAEVDEFAKENNFLVTDYYEPIDSFDIVAEELESSEWDEWQENLPVIKLTPHITYTKKAEEYYTDPDLIPF